MAFLERQGLAAWMEARRAGSLPAHVQEVELLCETDAPSDRLVLTLVDLVLGNRTEVKDD